MAASSIDRFATSSILCPALRSIDFKCFWSMGLIFKVDKKLFTRFGPPRLSMHGYHKKKPTVYYLTITMCRYNIHTFIILADNFVNRYTYKYQALCWRQNTACLLLLAMCFPIWGNINLSTVRVHASDMQIPP